MYLIVKNLNDFYNTNVRGVPTLLSPLLTTAVYIIVFLKARFSANISLDFRRKPEAVHCYDCVEKKSR